MSKREEGAGMSAIQVVALAGFAVMLVTFAVLAVCELLDIRP